MLIQPHQPLSFCIHHHHLCPSPAVATWPLLSNKGCRLLFHVSISTGWSRGLGGGTGNGEGDLTRCMSSSEPPPAPADKHLTLGTNTNHYVPTMSTPVTAVLATSLPAPSTTTTLHEFLNCNHVTAFWPAHNFGHVTQARHIINHPS